MQGGYSLIDNEFVEYKMMTMMFGHPLLHRVSDSRSMVARFTFGQ